MDISDLHDAVILARTRGVANPALESSLRREDRAVPATPLFTFDILALVAVYVPLEQLAARSLEEREAAADWAGAVALIADGGDGKPVEIPERPQWLPGRDNGAWEDTERKLQQEFDRFGGSEAVEDSYHTAYIDERPEDPGEELSDEAAALLDILEQVEDVRYKLRTLLGMPTEGYTADDTRVAGERSAGSTDHGDAAAATTDDRPAAKHIPAGERIASDNI
jgi:hypothetical protein